MIELMPAELAGLLGEYKNHNTVVYALPRGGVPVAMEVGRVLNWCLST